MTAAARSRASSSDGTSRRYRRSYDPRPAPRFLSYMPLLILYLIAMAQHFTLFSFFSALNQLSRVRDIGGSSRPHKRTRMLKEERRAGGGRRFY